MPKKSFSIYSSEDFAIEESDELVIEIAKSHLACLVVNPDRRSVSGFELFDLNETESENTGVLLSALSSQSSILTSQPSAVSIHINSEFCVPVPIFKFNKEIAAEYLNLVCGEDCSSKIQFEHLSIEPGIMNVFRINEDAINSFRSKFNKVSFHHTYSNIIRRAANISTSSPSELIIIQFYRTFMIVVVIKGGNLRLIQTFVYETTEDVLYNVLNITKQFELYSETLTIQISGIIDLDLKLYRELITYFKKVIVENVNEASLAPNMGETPIHYLTPFFNLAL